MPYRAPFTVLAPALALSVAAHALAECPADLDGDGLVSSADLTALLASWGECPPKSACPADLDGDGDVGAGRRARPTSTATGPCSVPT